MLYQKSDVFPNHISPAFEKLSEYPNFGNMLTRADLRYFCLFMHKEKIYFQTREIAQATRNSFPSVVKKVKTLSEWMPDDIDFNKVFAKWKRPPIDCNRKNADIRAGFKSGNDFLVNGCFTFGQRTVPEGLVHVFQTLNVPMLFYLRRKDKLDRTEDAYFPCHTMCRYERRILPANTCSRIPPRTTYFVLTVQKTFFRVDVLLDAVRSFQFLDPVAKKIAKLDCLYDHPAATPFIEDLYREPEDGTLNLEDWNLFFVPTTRELPVLRENDNNVLPEQQENDNVSPEPEQQQQQQQQENDNVSPEPEQQQQQQENDNVSPEPEQQQQQENDNVSPQQQQQVVSLPLQILEKKVIYVENTNLLKKLEYLKREIKCPPKCKHCSGSLPEDSSSIQPEPLDLSVQRKSETLGKRKREDGEKMPPPPPPLENAVVETVEFGEQQTVEFGEINLDEFGEQQTVEFGEINLDEFGEQQTVELGEINLDELEFLFK